MSLDLMKSKDNIPKMIVTDRNITLMNVVVIVFTKTIALVCQIHISKNVKVK